MDVSSHQESSRSARQQIRTRDYESDESSSNSRKISQLGKDHADSVIDLTLDDDDNVSILVFLRVYFVY